MKYGIIRGVVVACLLLAMSAHAQEFAPPFRSYAVGDAPFAVAAGDLDLDGNVDVVALADSGRTVSILRGMPGGRLGARVLLALPSPARSMALSDVTGDGQLDLIVAEPTALALYRGRGDMTLEFLARATLAGVPQSLVVGDFNADGLPDIAAGNREQTEIALLSWQPAGTLTLVQSIDVGFKPTRLASADLNRDGWPDLVACRQYSSDIAVLMNGGGWRFARGWSDASRTDLWDCAVADLDGDGIPDLVEAGYDGAITVWRGDGQGSFVFSQEVSTRSTLRDLALADVNRDGRPDILVANDSGRRFLTLLQATGFIFQPATATFVGNAPMSLVTCDANGDGVADVVTANSYSRSISVCTGNGDGTFGHRIDLPLPAEPTDVRLIDMDGDGALDLLLGFATPAALGVAYGHGDGTFDPVIQFGAGDQWHSHLDAVDFNGDGRPDLMVSDADSPGSHLSVVLNVGRGQFSAGPMITTSHRMSAALAADVDLDGRPDVLFADYATRTVSYLPVYSDFRLSFYRNRGDGSFESPRTFPLDAIVNRLAVTAVTGAPTRVVAVTNGGDVQVRSFVGLDSLGSPTIVKGPSELSGLRVVRANSDDWPDLVVAHGVFDKLSVCLGRPEGTFDLGPPVVAGVIPHTPVEADLTGDGSEDLIVPNEGSDTVTLMRGDGHGSYEALEHLGASVRPIAVDVGDLNGDGRLDLAVANAGTSTVSILLNGAGPLTPVEELQFEVRSRGERREVKWQVPESMRTDAFRVYVKSDGGPRRSLMDSPLTGQMSYAVLDDSPGSPPWFYWLEQIERSGRRIWHGPETVGTPLGEGVAVIHSPWPTPFREMATIEVDLPGAAIIQVDIFDATGRRITRLGGTSYPAGNVSLAWDGRDSGSRVMPNGVYFARVRAGTVTRTSRLVYAR